MCYIFTCMRNGWMTTVFKLRYTITIQFGDIHADGEPKNIFYEQITLFNRWLPTHAHNPNHVFETSIISNIEFAITIVQSRSIKYIFFFKWDKELMLYFLFKMIGSSIDIFGLRINVLVKAGNPDLDMWIMNLTGIRTPEYNNNYKLCRFNAIYLMHV